MNLRDVRAKGIAHMKAAEMRRDEAASRDAHHNSSSLEITHDELRALRDYWLRQDHWVRCLLQGCVYDSASDDAACRYCHTPRPKQVGSFMGIPVIADARLAADEAYLKDHRGALHDITSRKTGP